MSVRCPHCRVMVPLADSEIGAAGRMVCCEACGTRWLARHFADDPFSTDDFARAMRNRDAAEDAVVVEHVAPAFWKRAAEEAARSIARQPSAAPRLVKRMAFVLAAFLAVLALRAPLVAALPNLPAGLLIANGDLQFTQVRSQTLEMRGNSTLLVEGTIMNTSTADVALPAIRVTLRAADGAAVKSWLVEPAVAGLAPGRSIGFRSAVASPPQEATQVTLDLAGRQGT